MQEPSNALHQNKDHKKTNDHTLHLEKQLQDFARTGDVSGIQYILKNTVPGFNINSTDERGHSALFIALSEGHAVKTPEVVSYLLKNGATIKNGNIPQTDNVRKLLTQHANAKNIQYIFKLYHDAHESFLNDTVILEVGSGDGYLKYLSSLSDDPVTRKIRDRIVETESSHETVAENVRRNKYTIEKRITELPQVFGNSFTPCVISMNVLDTFSENELTINLRTIHNLLKQDGMIIHIMSSSIHPNCFDNIRKSYPDKLTLPYYQDGYLGLRLISKNINLNVNNNTLEVFSENPCDLFKKNPNKYIEISDLVTNIVKINHYESSIIKFSDYFILKIKKAFKYSGFRLIYQEEISAEVIVAANQHHKQFQEANCFNNMLGALIVDKNNKTSRPNDVIERSTFLVLMGQKV